MFYTYLGHSLPIYSLVSTTLKHTDIYTYILSIRKALVTIGQNIRGLRTHTTDIRSTPKSQDNGTNPTFCINTPVNIESSLKFPELCNRVSNGKRWTTDTRIHSPTRKPQLVFPIHTLEFRR